MSIQFFNNSILKIRENLDSFFVRKEKTITRSVEIVFLFWAIVCPYVVMYFSPYDAQPYDPTEANSFDNPYFLGMVGAMLWGTIATHCFQNKKIQLARIFKSYGAYRTTQIILALAFIPLFYLYAQFVKVDYWATQGTAAQLLSMIFLSIFYAMSMHENKQPSNYKHWRVQRAKAYLITGNNRIIKTVHEGKAEFAIHGVYYEKGEIKDADKDPEAIVYVHASTEVRAIELLNSVLKQPVVDIQEIEDTEWTLDVPPMEDILEVGK